ncbi:hypothetical protein QFZ30_000575 [Arthrobacter pascens]|uniref:IniB N-terminal domain-containing protein n=1 Tax=Arthrobacter pascens TaxID=1677 RepID=UPI00278F9664|nr:IniB N-terminal domain-containing protein [Arthrobacter pascens]MDQ0677193.1 hypothetical protein [Arthrobacter pascens]
MPTLANQLVQFLMSLFNNPATAQNFLNDPERALEDAGLGKVSAADVDAVMPVVLDYAPITVNASSFDREYNTGGNSAWTGYNGGGGGGNGGGGHHDDHSHAVQQLHHVVNNYSYTSTVDDRDTVTDQSINQNVWADGDVKQFFDNDAIIASGDQAMAAGDDFKVEDSFNVEDSYNTDNSEDNSINAGRDASVGNVEIDVVADDSFNTDNSVDIDAELENVGNTDNSDNSVEIEKSFNDDSETTKVEVDDSFNDQSTEVAIEEFFNDNSETETTKVEFEESFKDNPETEITEVDIKESFNPVDVEVEESFNEDKSVNVEDSELEANTEIDESTVF